VLSEISEVNQALDDEALAACFDPLRYQGAGGAFVDRALAHHAAVFPPSR
jgi:hypothetical protein